MTDPQILADTGAELAVYRDAPAWGGRRTAAIGKIRFEDADTAAALLERTMSMLRDEGFEGLLGPMDGDTWHSYRTVAETDGSPPFALEPVSGTNDLSILTSAGFSPVSTYMSARGKLSDAIGDEPFSMDGITVSAWDGQGAEGLISRLFALSGNAFAGNEFFKPITQDSFLELYRPILPMIDPRYVLFARDGNGEMVGFLFGYPDLLDRTSPSAVLKTYASRRNGVGHLLADTFHRNAMAMGHETVIHALMHENNTSLRRSGKHKAAVFRRYALLAMTL